MTKVYSSFPHINGNLLAAVDLECTGLRAGYHEPIQIAVVPLDSDCKPLDGVRPFYTSIKPLWPQRAEATATTVHKLDIASLVNDGLHPDRVADLLVEWFDRLELPSNKSLIPLAHNWAYESSFLNAWLGESLRDRLFFGHARDAMLLALALNDRSFFRGEKAPFNSVSLTSMCNKFSIVNQRPHDALADALAEAEVYRHLMKLEIF